jgi:ribonuclease D
MTVITEQGDLEDMCAALAEQPYVAVDTEFLRDRTYYPQLCLVQISPPEDVGDPVAIDPLATLDLAPLLELMRNPNVLKVFHAARQDLEIFYNLMGEVPHPLFDSQVAAMVCGYGDQAGYNTLVQEICHQRIDKGAQFTDWARRPLSDKQLTYALDDVHWLRRIYLALDRQLAEKGRGPWVESEMAILTNPDTYRNPPDEAWERIKIKTDRPQVLSVLKELASWREQEAQRRNIPRNRVLRDEVLADMAVHPPKTMEDLKHIRNLGDDILKSRHAATVLEAAQRGLAVPKGEGPVSAARERFPQELQPVLEMLKMLLRIVASEQGVAARLIASGEDLEALARDDNADIDTLKGWRLEAFGRQALDLKHGKLALSLEKGVVVKRPV